MSVKIYWFYSSYKSVRLFCCISFKLHGFKFIILESVKLYHFWLFIHHWYFMAFLYYLCIFLFCVKKIQVYILLTSLLLHIIPNVIKDLYIIWFRVKPFMMKVNPEKRIGYTKFISFDSINLTYLEDILRSCKTVTWQSHLKSSYWSFKFASFKNISLKKYV